MKKQDRKQQASSAGFVTLLLAYYLPMNSQGEFDLAMLPAYVQKYLNRTLVMAMILGGGAQFAYDMGSLAWAIALGVPAGIFGVLIGVYGIVYWDVWRN